jgi:hypothetical protein
MKARIWMLEKIDSLQVLRLFAKLKLCEHFNTDAYLKILYTMNSSFGKMKRGMT